jgi:hypothetical protein
MPEFTVAQTPSGSDGVARWQVKIDGSPHRQYSSEWAAIIDAVCAAHDATRWGEEAIIVMETSAKQAWTFSLLPDAATSRAAANDSGRSVNRASDPVLLERAG